MDKPQAEILVHIAAPARAADDAKYRTLAAAYLSFEARARTLVSFGTQRCTDQNGEIGQSQSEVVHQSNPGLGGIQSPLLSFQSAIDNLDSPPLQRAVNGCIPASQLSWKAPPSVIQDSMPENDLVFPQYCTPTRILNHYASGLDSTQTESSPIPWGGQYLTPSIPDRHRKHPIRNIEGQQRQTHEVENEGPVISLSPSTDKPCYRRTTPTPSEEPRIASSFPSQQPEPVSPYRSESEPPLSKRPRTYRDPALGKPITRSASDMGPRPRPAKAGMARRQALDTLEILSPPPITGQRELRPEDMVTDVLATLAQKLNLEKRFRPESQTRDLRPFERGYWLVDCTSWEPELKQSAWAFLTDYLSKGCAGWGTSCRRDPNFSWIRLYCWGCVVGHTYLVVYLMSQRRILYTGTSWIGGDGKPVIVMGARQAMK
ncbi:hypothetical protein C8A03DRAFT_34159 [Achaetomium macrosporum]|uniref:Uncharacterized protein n=1 Tax=Achaetomium macrosporum TaxID=79813 RepID=A0AAN7HDR8_9PEZI|nr:hypothetical protein C8A03DRAFT_34159 [Achaetomium macrosporum]